MMAFSHRPAVAAGGFCGKLPGLKEIKIGPGRRSGSGALVRWRAILDDKRLDTAHPLLQEARLPRLRITRSATAATVGGFLRPMPIRRRRCPASRKPATQKITVMGKDGARTIKAKDLLSRARSPPRSPPTRSSPRYTCRPGQTPRRYGFEEFARRRGRLSPWPALRSTTMCRPARPRTPTSA